MIRRDHRVIIEPMSNKVEDTSVRGKLLYTYPFSGRWLGNRRQHGLNEITVNISTKRNKVETR